MANGPTYARHVPPPPLPFEAEAGRVVDGWGRAAKLRARVNSLLRHHGLTFSQWRMIHATDALVRETGDMVSQLQVGRRAQLDRTTASKLMFKLGERGWLDWGPDYYDSAYRILATEKAQQMLSETRPKVVALAQILGFGGENRTR